MLEEVRNEKLNEQVLIEKLRTHVEQCDATAALEHVTASGGGNAHKRQELYLAPLNDGSEMVKAIHHKRFVLQIHQAALLGAP